MSSVPRLSCSRCKQKKLRCDKQEPCSRCKAAGAPCASLERKSRTARTFRNKEKIDSLNLRINLLEQTLHRATDQPSSDKQPTSGDRSQQGSQERTASSVTVDSTLHHHSQAMTSHQGSQPHTSVDKSADSLDWIDRFREVRTMMNASISNLNSSDQSMTDPDLSEAINVLDGAIADLDKFTDVAEDKNAPNVLTKDEAREAVRVALELTSGEFFTSLLDRDLMLSLSDIISSPHILIDPAARMVYQCLIFHGHIMCQYKSPTAARRLYLLCLQIVPAWQSSPNRTTMDLIAASLLSWTCAVSSDSQLAWQFHRKACEYVREVGIDQLDVVTTQRGRDNVVEEDKRRGFWQLVLADIMYRLTDGKPSSISSDASLSCVHMSDYPDPSQRQPPAVLTITSILWGRIIFIIKQYCDYRDNPSLAHEDIQTEEHHAKLEECVEQIENLIDDWNVLSLVKANGKKAFQTQAYAEIALNAYHCICHLERIRTSAHHSRTTDRSLRASRIIIDLISDVHEMSAGTRYNASYQYSIAFYPFHACFVLYYYILGSSQPNDYQDDVKRLEKLGKMLSQVARSRFEYVSIAKAITSLNHIVKHVQRARKSEGETMLWMPTPESQAMLMQAAMTQSNSPHNQFVQQGYLNDFSYDPTGLDFVQYLPPFEGEQMHSATDFQNLVSDANFDPLSYMQEVEQQFLERTSGQSSLWQQYESTM